MTTAYLSSWYSKTLSGIGIWAASRISFMRSLRVVVSTVENHHLNRSPGASNEILLLVGCLLMIYPSPVFAKDAPRPPCRLGVEPSCAPGHLAWGSLDLYPRPKGPPPQRLFWTSCLRPEAAHSLLLDGRVHQHQSQVPSHCALSFGG